MHCAFQTQFSRQGVRAEIESETPHGRGEPKFQLYRIPGAVTGTGEHRLVTFTVELMLIVFVLKPSGLARAFASSPRSSPTAVAPGPGGIEF